MQWFIPGTNIPGVWFPITASIIGGISICTIFAILYFRSQ